MNFGNIMPNSREMQLFCVIYSLHKIGYTSMNTNINESTLFFVSYIPGSLDNFTGNRS